MRKYAQEIRHHMEHFFGGGGQGKESEDWKYFHKKIDKFSHQEFLLLIQLSNERLILIYIYI